ncbi:MAG: ATPase [Mangrovibacterium sp.]|nr:ATPase [Mangrovibacterium sp.]
MTIKLIADSGSTKAEWKLISGESVVKTFQTRGMNPYFLGQEAIVRELQENVLPETGTDVAKIFLYGAGVTSQENSVREALCQVFPCAHIETHSDVLGASRALFGRSAGIACTLGTGSNACFYNGVQIAGRVPPLGFILGDECSGSAFGKKLLGDYFKQVMPPSVRLLFHETFSPELQDVLDRVYRTERPNFYLAAFAPFLSAHINEPYCRTMVEESFRDFFVRNVLSLGVDRSLPIGFTGSVAYYFSEVVTQMTEAFGFNRPIVLKNPITGLVAYHQNKINIP